MHCLLGSPRRSDLVGAEGMSVAARYLIDFLTQICKGPKKFIESLGPYQKSRINAQVSDPLAVDLLERLLQWSPTKRVTTADALQRYIDRGSINPIFSLSHLAHFWATGVFVFTRVCAHAVRRWMENDCSPSIVSRFRLMCSMTLISLELIRYPKQKVNSVGLVCLFETNSI